MATQTATHTQLPDYALTTVTLVQTLGFDWEFNHEYPTPRGEKEQRVQIRDEHHVSPTQQVTFYAAAMKRGEKFPPIVVTKDGFIVDGNTRIAAANRIGFLSLPAVIVDETWNGASASVRQRLHTLGAAFNVRNGKGIDQKEIRRAVFVLAKDKTYDGVRIASLLGVPDRVVKNILTEHRARARAEKHGVTVNGSVPATQLRRLGGSIDKLNAAPFMELLSLTQDAGLTDPELAGLIVKVRGADDDTAALALLAEERDARREQIADFKARGKAVASDAVKLRQRLGFILPFVDAPEQLVEHSPNFAAVHLQQIETVIDILQRVALAQRGR